MKFEKEMKALAERLPKDRQFFVRICTDPKKAIRALPEFELTLLTKDIESQGQLIKLNLGDDSRSWPMILVSMATNGKPEYKYDPPKWEFFELIEREI